MSKTGRAIMWRNAVGFDRDLRIKYGLGKGSPDLIGVRLSDQKFVAVEVKTAKGRLSKEQQAWLAYFEGLGFYVGCARSVAEALRIVFPEDYK